MNMDGKWANQFNQTAPAELLCKAEMLLDERPGRIMNPKPRHRGRSRQRRASRYGIRNLPITGDKLLG
jgi:hypothetical protein